MVFVAGPVIWLGSVVGVVVVVVQGSVVDVVEFPLFVVLSSSSVVGVPGVSITVLLLTTVVKVSDCDVDFVLLEVSLSLGITMGASVEMVVGCVVGGLD